MASQVRRRPQTNNPSHGSRTITINDSQPREADEAGDSAAGPSRTVDGVLILRGGPGTRHHVAWSDTVVDNEGLGRKKSKICCIYHKPKSFDESSDEESSSDEDSDDSAGDRARPPRHARRHRHHDHDHDHGHEGRSDSSDSAGPGPTVRAGGEGGQTELEEKAEPNAYERQPKYPKGKGKPLD